MTDTELTILNAANDLLSPERRKHLIANLIRHLPDAEKYHLAAHLAQQFPDRRKAERRAHV